MKKIGATMYYFTNALESSQRNVIIYIEKKYFALVVSMAMRDYHTVVVHSADRWGANY